MFHSFAVKIHVKRKRGKNLCREVKKKLVGAVSLQNDEEKKLLTFSERKNTTVFFPEKNGMPERNRTGNAIENLTALTEKTEKRDTR